MLVTASNSVLKGQWAHITITYDGNTTGVASDQVSNYYNRFKIYINGQIAATTNSNANYGYNSTNSISSASFGDAGVKLASVGIWTGVRNAGGVQNAYSNGNLLDYMDLQIKPRYYAYFTENGVQQEGVVLTSSTSSSQLDTDVPPS